jgi:hypothetical protein
MNCPNCRHEHANEARFCAQCGAPLTPTATPTPPPEPARRRTIGLLALALVLLLLAAGGYVAFHVAATRRGTPPTADAQNSAPANGSNQQAAGTRQSAQAAGRGLGTALGAGAKGDSDSAEAPDNPTQAGQPVAQHDTVSGTTDGTPASPDAGQAASAVGGFLGALTASLGGPHRHDPVDFHTLEALLPSSLPGMPDATPTGNADETMSIKSTAAHVDFSGPSDARIHLSIKDATAISGLAGLADMANPNSVEDGGSYEKTETIDGRSVHEKWTAASRHGELSLSVGQRFAVDAVGDNVEMEALKHALARIDLAKLESMKDANPQTK